MPDHACDRGAVRLDPGASRSQAYQPDEDALVHAFAGVRTFTGFPDTFRQCRPNYAKLGNMTGQEEMLAVSDAGYAEMASRYEALMAEAEQNGARWTWYTDYGLDPRPLHFYLSRYDWPPGRPLLRQPRRIASGRVLYALDSIGHPLLAREAVRVGERPLRYYDTFFRDLSDGKEILHFSYSSHEPVYYERLYHSSGRLAGSVTTAQHGRGIRRFHYDTDGRLAEVEYDHGAEREPVRPWSKLVISYDQAGDVREVWQEWRTGGREREYSKDS
jgi:hypothetical protein